MGGGGGGWEGEGGGMCVEFERNSTAQRPLGGGVGGEAGRDLCVVFLRVNNLVLDDKQIHPVLRRRNIW